MTAIGSVSGMSTISIILSIVLALVLIASAIRDFSGPPEVLDIVRRLGYRPGFERTLGIIKGLGGLGLAIGVAWAPIGVLAAAGSCAYFVLAVRAHAKLGDPGRESMPAAVLFGVSFLTLVTRVLA